MTKVASRSSCRRATSSTGVTSTSSTTSSSPFSPLPWVVAHRPPPIPVPRFYLIGVANASPPELLQRSGIAWPHANMPIVSNPLHSAADPRPQPLHLDDDGASRSSSSTYSSYPPSAYHFGMPSTFATHPPTALSLNSHAWPPNVPMRLPSDQLQLILDKIQCRSASVSQGHTASTRQSSTLTAPKRMTCRPTLCRLRPSLSAIWVQTGVVSRHASATSACMPTAPPTRTASRKTPMGTFCTNRHPPTCRRRPLSARKREIPPPPLLPLPNVS